MTSKTIIPARALAPFESRPRFVDPEECLLITNDLERVEKVGKKEIRCVPLVLFLLGLWVRTPPGEARATTGGCPYGGITLRINRKANQ